MLFVGVIDHLGLVSALSRHAKRLTPTFSHVIVDEAQDFGTLELSLIRRLVPEGPNDIFLCGDPVQRVHAKHRVVRQAGLDIPPARSFSLRRNYRNTREILSLADRVLLGAIAQCSQSDPDFTRIEPELACRSGSVPLLLTASSLSEEIACALRFAEETEATETKRLCIAIAGFTLREVQSFAKRAGLPVLDGTIGLGFGKVFLSDLEQTKGYEFDTICVLNCAEGIIPDPGLPEEERFRQASRLYVAMTRAKRELILSCSGVPSPWITGIPDGLERNLWADHVITTELRDIGCLAHLPELPETASDVGMLTGQEFLYTPYALGMSPERQERLERLVSGNERLQDGRQISWRNLSSAAYALDNQPSARSAFGGGSWLYFQSLFRAAGVQPQTPSPASFQSVMAGFRPPPNPKRKAGA